VGDDEDGASAGSIADQMVEESVVVEVERESEVERFSEVE